MKILQVISSSGFYGAESVVLQLSTELTALGHTVVVGVFHDMRGPSLELAQEARRRGQTVHSFECRGRWDRSTVKSMETYIASNQVAVVHSHGYKANIYARLANRRTGACLVGTCHNWIDSSLKMRLYNAADRWNLRAFDAVIAVSAPVKDRLLRSGVASAKVQLIGNGVDIDLFGRPLDGRKIRREFGFGSEDRVIGTVGRLSKEKGNGDFLRAAKDILAREPRSKFLIVGDGPLMGDLMRQAAHLQLAEHVVFAGKRQDIAELLAVMDVFVLPSLTEGLPMALLEAMAAAKPVVATAVGAVPEILEGGEFGTIVPPGSPQALVSAIEHLASDDRKATEMGKRARAAVTAKYSVKSMASRYVSVYQDLIREKGVGS